MDTLVITLPGSVDNENLRKLNELKIAVTTERPPSTATIQYWANRVAGSSMPQRIVGANPPHFCNEDATTDYGVTHPLETYNYIQKNKDGTLFIGNKQSLTELMIRTSGLILNLDELVYCSSLTKYTAATNYNSNGDISAFADKPHFKILEIRGNGVVGDVAAFTGYTEMTQAIFENTSVTGDVVAAFGGCVSLTRAYFYGTSTITADLETGDNLADAMVAAGRTSGSLQYTSVSRGQKTYTFASGGRGWTAV